MVNGHRLVIGRDKNHRKHLKIIRNNEQYPPFVPPPFTWSQNFVEKSNILDF